MTHWWQSLFEEEYLRMFAEARPPLRTEQEVEAIMALLDWHDAPEEATILDLACGYGRVTLPLAEAGFVMTGLDLSPRLLAEARSRQGDLAVFWQQGDMRGLPDEWTDRFDTVLNLFSAFGYFDEPAENQKVLDEVRRVLKPGGLFIIDLAQRDAIMRDFRPTDWFEVDDLLVCVSREFDAISGINTEYWLWADEQGERQSLYFKVHLYTVTELTAMLRAAGLEPVGYLGDLAVPLEHNPFDAFTSRLVVVARKVQADDR